MMFVTRYSGQRLALWLLTALLLALLTACATAPTVAHDDKRDPNQPVVLVENFIMTGRLSVRVGDRLDTARIEWTRDSRDGALRETMKFFSPFGSQLAEVVATPTRTTLRRGDSVEEATSIGVLTQSLVGVAFDTASLLRWLQGVDLDKAAALTVNAQGKSPAKWTITAENFRPIADVPNARVAARIVAIEGETTLKVIVDEFRPL